MRPAREGVKGVVTVRASAEGVQSAEVKVVLRHASKKELKKYLRPYDPEGHDATKLI